MEERFFYLLKQRITGIANQDEERELNQLLEDNEEFRQLYTILFRNTSAMSEEDLLETEQAFASHSVKMQLSNMFDESEKASAPFPVATKPSRNKLYWAMAVAGAFIGFAFFYFKSSMNLEEPPQKNEVATRKGSKSKITLPDSTVVWLNADSRIIYSDNFRGNKREVQLTGEAFFEVAKDASKPFVVTVDAITVQAIGTAFNINQFDKAITLTEGVIQISNEQHQRFLQPGDQWHEGGKISKVDVQPITAWTKNEFKFKHATLTEIMPVLQRWYDCEIIYADSIGYHFNGTIDRSVPVSRVLELLEGTGHVHFTIEKNTITIKK